MSYDSRNIISLLESLKIDGSDVICYFRCNETGKNITSKVPLEPYAGKITFTWIEILLHPLQSYEKYYHTPITIYSSRSYETVVLRAFEKVSNHFIWNEKQEKYEYYKG